MKKQCLKLGAFMLAIALLIPSIAPARHKKGHHDQHDQYEQHDQYDDQYESTQQPYKQKKDRTVLGSALGFSALGAITAGAAGSGKWVPLGLVGGALAGWAIGKAIEHGKKKRMEKGNRVVRERKRAYAY